MGLNMKKILIFGGAGSLGTELTKYYIDKYHIVVVSRDEAKHFDLKNKIKNNNLKTIVSDVRDENRIKDILLQEKPEIIIIAQALKQVDICEYFPEESIKTNILGVMNIINSLRTLSLMNAFSPEAICFVSTDKAANPINIYGMCKSISEKLSLNLSHDFENTDTRVVIVRYGNVLSSKGSIIPLLVKQGEDINKDKFSLTHQDMTRFMMTLNEAVKLIDATISSGNNGDMWVPKLKSMKILDLIKYFSTKYNKPYEIIGIRPGEKIHEIMLSLEEALRVDIKQDYFIFNKNNPIKNHLNKEYSSMDYLLSYNELEGFMTNYFSTSEESCKL
jgi:UDP-N-acetylglucosamine 4,6-dehydratase